MAQILNSCNYMYNETFTKIGGNTIKLYNNGG